MRGYLKTSHWVFKLQPKRTTIGRHKDSDLCLQNGGVEEQHAVIEWHESELCYVLSDLNSVHGTYVNDCRIHNAAVHLSAGDKLHFGYGGSTYQLLLDTTGPLPVLPSQSAAPLTRGKVRAKSPSITPRPPSRARPTSAGAKQTALSPNGLESWGHSHRPGSWSTGRGLAARSITTPWTSYSTEELFQDKDESWSRHGEELNFISGSERAAQSRERIIKALREEVTSLQLQLSQSNQRDLEIRHKLGSLAEDIQEKKEEIRHLKEQMIDVQTRSGELIGQAVAERDQRISKLLNQVDSLKGESGKAAVQVQSLQKDLTSREKQALRLAAEVDRLRQDMRHKDAQLSNMAVKLSKLKETEKHQEEFLAKEKEVESLKKSVRQLEATLREKQMEMKTQNTERDSLKHRLEQMMQDQVSLQDEINRLKLLQQHTLQRDQKSQTDLRHTQTRLENLRKHIANQILFIPETAPDQQMMDRLSELANQKEVFRCRVQGLEQKLKDFNDSQKLVERDTERLKARLVECQSCVQNVGVAEALQCQISGLRSESVCPALSWVQTHSLSLLDSIHILLQSAEGRLREAGTEVSEKNGGVLAAVKVLCQQHLEIQRTHRSLKAENEQLEGRLAQTDVLQGRLETARLELERQKLQVAERQAEAVNTVKLQLEKITAELESARKAEAAMCLEAKTMEAEWRNKLEEAEKMETKLREMIREKECLEKQWMMRAKEENEREEEWSRKVLEALQKGAEEEKQRLRVEIEEYREQVRQHAHTIVAMEKQVSTAEQRDRDLQEERDSLTQQLAEALSKLESPEQTAEPPEKSTEQQDLEQTVASLSASLDVSQKEVDRQGALITSLSRDLAHAHARLSDLTGSLTEQQKVELETHRALVIDQRMQLSTLTQKLTTITQLVEQKENELKMLREKLIMTETDLKRETERRRELDQNQVQLYSGVAATTSHTKDVALMVRPNDLTSPRSKCKGQLREEMVRQQKEGLSEMKSRIRALEQKWPSKRLVRQGEPVRQGQMRTRTSLSSVAQKSFSSTESGFAFPEALSEAALERTARLDMSDALELSERTYVDLARALCEVLDLSEQQLSGCSPLRHLPPGEREQLSSLRQQDLQLFRSRLALQNSQSQDKDLQLQECQMEIHKLRESQAMGQRLQAELDTVQTELDSVKQDGDSLRQALHEAQSQLQQEWEQNSAILKNNKALNVGYRSRRVGHQNCVPNENNDKVTVLKRPRQQEERRRRKMKEDKEESVDVETQTGFRDQTACNVAAHLASLPKQRQRTELTEAH